MNMLTTESSTLSHTSSVNRGWPTNTTSPEALHPVGTEASREQVLHAVYVASVERIYAFVLFKIGSHERAEDITSEVFIKAAQFLDVTQNEKARLSWLYQVARTTITDYWRVYYKQPASSLEQLEAAGQFQFADEALLLSSEQGEELSATAKRLNAVLGQLPAKYRRVLELRFLYGYSLKETAEAMGLTQGNVKVLQHRALSKAARTTATIM